MTKRVIIIEDDEAAEKDWHIMPAQTYRPWWMGRRIEGSTWLGIVVLSPLILLFIKLWEAL